MIFAICQLWWIRIDIFKDERAFYIFRCRYSPIHRNIMGRRAERSKVLTTPTTVWSNRSGVIPSNFLILITLPLLGPLPWDIFVSCSFSRTQRVWKKWNSFIHQSCLRFSIYYQFVQFQVETYTELQFVRTIGTAVRRKFPLLSKSFQTTRWHFISLLFFCAIWNPEKTNVNLYYNVWKISAASFLCILKHLRTLSQIKPSHVFHIRCRIFFVFKTLLEVFDKFHVCTYTYSQLSTLIIAVSLNIGTCNTSVFFVVSHVHKILLQAIDIRTSL